MTGAQCHEAALPAGEFPIAAARLGPIAMSSRGSGVADNCRNEITETSKARRRSRGGAFVGEARFDAWLKIWDLER